MAATVKQPQVTEDRNTLGSDAPYTLRRNRHQAIQGLTAPTNLVIFPTGRMKHPKHNEFDARPHPQESEVEFAALGTDFTVGTCQKV